MLFFLFGFLAGGIATIVAVAILGAMMRRGDITGPPVKGQWVRCWRCAQCRQEVSRREVYESQGVCPNCGHWRKGSGLLDVENGTKAFRGDHWDYRWG